MNPSNLSLRQKSRGTVVKTIAIHLYGARDPNYIVDLTLSNLVSCPAAPPTYGKVRLVTIDAFLGPSAPKWGWPIRVERNDVITLFDGGTMDSLWALTS